MTALIISAFVGIVACTVGTFYMFRKELDRQSNALWTCIHDRAEADLLELRNHVTLFGNTIRQENTAVRTEVSGIHDFVKALGGKSFADVLTARNDLLTAVDGLHTKIDAIPAAAEAAVHNAAAASINSARRTCQWCNRTVHSFVVEAGVVKCTDCKAKTASN